MQPFVQLVASLSGSGADLAALAVLFVFMALFVIFTARAKDGLKLSLRPIAVYRRLQQLTHQAEESAQPIHVNLGSAAVGGESTAETSAALTVYDYVIRHAAACDQPTLGTMGNATIMATAQGMLHSARQEAGLVESYSGQEAQFYGPDAMAFAGGARLAADDTPHMADVLVGSYGPEALWLSEISADAGTPMVGGSSDPVAATLMTASLDETVIGEDLYAAGAYLHRPSHLGSLITQDIMRVLTILVIVVGVILLSLGIWR